MYMVTQRSDDFRDAGPQGVQAMTKLLHAISHDPLTTTRDPQRSE